MHGAIPALQAELAAGAGGAGLQGDSTGQQQRLLEAHAQFVARVGQVLLQFGQGARLVPEAMGNGARETKQPGADGAQVDWIEVTRGPGITPADIRRCAPLRHLAEGEWRWRRRVDRYAGHRQAATEHAAFAFPEQAQLVFQASDQAEHTTLAVGL